MSIVTHDGLVHGVCALPRKAPRDTGLTWCGERFDDTVPHTHRPVTCLDCHAGEVRYKTTQLDGQSIVDFSDKELLRARRDREKRIKKMIGSLYPNLLRKEIQDINTELTRRRSEMYHRA